MYFLSLLVVGGCAGPAPTSPELYAEEVANDDALISRKERTHHFGPAIGAPGRKLEHGFPLVNRSDREVRIVEVINRKPCCGEVKLNKSLLAPGESAEVEVVVSVEGRFGDLMHEAVVVTDPPSKEEIALRSTVKVYPPLRIEEAGASVSTSSPNPGQPRRREFLVSSHGTSADPCIDLDRLDLKSSAEVRWIGPMEEAEIGTDLDVRTRRFVALLDVAGPAGRRKASVALRDGDRTVFEHELNWQVVAPVGATPKLLALQSGKDKHRLLLTSSDGRPFRITRVESTVDGVRGQVADGDAAALRIVVVEDGRTETGPARGSLTVYTDHPSQEQVDIPIVSIE